MRKSFFTAAFMCLQLFLHSEVIIAAESSNRSIEVHSKSDKLREQRLQSGLKEILDADFEIKGDTLVFKGSQAQHDNVLGRLNDFNLLRQIIIPTSSNEVVTQACAAPKFSSWKECLTSLGVTEADVSNFSINNALDVDGSQKISIKSGFNKTLASMYLDEIKKGSPFFDWINRHNPKLITYDSDYMFINYGLLTEFFCTPQVEIEPVSGSDTSTLKLPLHAVLKRLMSAVGDDISLVKASTPGKYHVRTIMLGDKYEFDSNGENSTIEIVIDNSGSMSGDKINTINAKMPRLLEQFRTQLEEGQSLNVKVFKFNNDITLHQTFDLIYSDKAQIKWDKISIKGGTDLTNVTNRLKLTSQDEDKVVVAFTDGQHEEPKVSLDESFASLKKAQHEGSFAKPYFCCVGKAGETDPTYFSKVSDIFAGSFQEHQTIDDFCSTVASNIPSLLESNVPMVLTIDGVDITIRQPNAKPDIFVTPQEVKEGDSVMLQGNRRTINFKTSLQAEIERLQKQLAALGCK